MFITYDCVFSREVINVFFAQFLAWLAVSRFMLAVSEPSFSPLHSRSLISALNLQFVNSVGHFCMFVAPIFHLFVPFPFPSIINSHLRQLTDLFNRPFPPYSRHSFMKSFRFLSVVSSFIDWNNK